MAAVVGVEAAEEAVFGGEGAGDGGAEVDEGEFFVGGMGLLMGGDGVLELFGVVLAEGDEEDDVGVGGAAAEGGEALDDAGLGVAGVGLVEGVVGAVIDEDEGGLVAGLAIGAEVALGIEQGVVVAVDFVPAACGVVVLSAGAVGGVCDDVVAGDIAGWVVAGIDPAAPAAGVDAVFVALGLQGLADELGVR